MWIFLPDGFFSIVQDRASSHLLQVRARNRADLERHFPGQPIIETPHADYHYRVVVDRHLVSNWLAGHVLALDYQNVKGAIDYADQERKDAMSAVWAVMHQYQADLEGPMRPEATCVGCGCTDSHACDAGIDACHWLELDREHLIGVCSQCSGALAKYRRELKRLRAGAA